MQCSKAASAKAGRQPPLAPLQPDRPRERLAAFGRRSLTDRELLALVVGTGSRGSTALQTAAGLLADGGLRELARADVRQLSRQPGVGRARASQLVAVFEIARRLRAAAPVRGLAVRQPRDLASYLVARYGDERTESFGIVLLDGRNRFVREQRLSKGGWSASVVRPREIFREALLTAAPALILFHNHPSGDPTPSREDVGATRQVCEAGDLLGIRVLDHLVVGAEGFVSMRERGLI